MHVQIAESARDNFWKSKVQKARISRKIKREASNMYGQTFGILLPLTSRQETSFPPVSATTF